MHAMRIGAVAVLLGVAGLAQAAESNHRYNGQYYVSGATHRAPPTKGKVPAKQRSAPHFNPKEISVEQSVPWQKAPKNSSRQMKSRSPHLFD